VGWPPYPCARTSPQEATAHFAPPSHCSAVLLATLLRTGGRFTHYRQPPPTSPTRLKEVPHHHAPPAPRTCLWRWLAKPGNRSYPAVVFLCEHPTGGSLLRLFPNYADPTASSVPQRSSSQTTSLAASTSPSSAHQFLLPVDTCVTVERALPVSTPFAASAFGFSCSCM
jgi:hypothetical protein